MYLALCLPLFTHAQETNAGFVQGLWYASNPVFAEIPNRIYVAIRNNTPHDLTSTVRFTDNGKRIGSSEIHALSGHLVEAWVDWTPTYGEHAVVATLTNTELDIIGAHTQPADITQIIAKDTLTIDLDTDKDGIGNQTDTDDDNDRISDSDEKIQGNDPLVANPKIQKTTEVTQTASHTQAVTSTKLAEATTEQGLEKYTGDGAVGTLLMNVTSKVEAAKASLDTYREKRNTILYSDTPSSTAKEIAPRSSLDTATITRTHIGTSHNFFSTLLSSSIALIQNIWTALLFALSRALTHPALLQFLILVGILGMVYRISSRLGRRPKRR
jgi:hypothetical protein